MFVSFELLHFTGEKPAAMQHSSAALHWYSFSVIFIVECVFLKLNGVAGSLQEWL
jgi:hypothetical protein